MNHYAHLPVSDLFVALGIVRGKCLQEIEKGDTCTCRCSYMYMQVASFITCTDIHVHESAYEFKKYECFHAAF